MHTPTAPATEPVEALPLGYAAGTRTLTDGVGEPERLEAIDLARGFALLGILMVNMQFFSQAFGELIGPPAAPAGSTWADVGAYYFIWIFCTGKFYPLFSMLFGIGFMIQLERARVMHRRFVPAYLRRLAVLFVIGASHALLLWYGDILFVYSIAGLILFAVLMIFPRASARALLLSGIGLVVFSMLLGLGLNLAVMALEGASQQRQADSALVDAAGGASGAATQPATLPATVPATQAATLPASEDAAMDSEADATTAPAFAAPRPRIYQRFLQAFEDGRLEGNPADPLWIDLETQAYREGTYLDAFVFRAITWLMFLVFAIIGGFGLHILGMFFIGAALLRGGVVSNLASHWHKRLLVAGIVLGLPLVLLGIFVARDGGAGKIFMAALNMIGGPLMSLAYLSGAVLLVRSGGLRTIIRAVARVGRMGLTNYLTETILATFLMYSWGLGWFGMLMPADQVLVVVGIYALLLVTSAIWLTFFQYGPMEWLWRSLTYMRLQPLRR